MRSIVRITVAASESARTPEVDLGSLDFWATPAEQRDRYFAELRRDAPISRHRPPEDIMGLPEQERMSYWAIVRYEDVRGISRDPETFCSGQGVQFADAPPEFLEASQSFLAMDALRHTKLRGLVSAAFTPRQVARIEEGIRENARRIVAEAAPHGGGDFVELIAKQLPLVTISNMIGVPEADRERVVAAADLLITTSDPEVFGDRLPIEVLGEALWTLTSFATDLAAHREENPADDLMTALVQAEVDGERLARAQLRSIFRELLRVIPDIEAQEPELLRSAFIHGVKRMDCAFTPRQSHFWARTWGAHAFLGSGRKTEHDRVDSPRSQDAAGPRSDLRPRCGPVVRAAQIGGADPGRAAKKEGRARLERGRLGRSRARRGRTRGGGARGRRSIRA